MRTTLISLAIAASFAAVGANAAPLMSADWAAQACQYWNTNPALTTELAEKWAKNDGGRGHKIIHMYRTDCGEASKVEMTISTKGGRTTCVYAGPIKHHTLNYDMDYLMHAETKRWKEMGAGRIRSDARHDVRPSEIRRPEGRSHEGHGPVRAVPADPRQGSRRRRLPGQIIPDCKKNPLRRVFHFWCAVQY
jgi:putative sterol carrier protein